MAATIPAGVRAPAFDPDRRVEVPCAAILNGPVPKISLTTLADLIPECFATRNFSETWIRLPATRLALAYHMIFDRELIEEPGPEIPEPEPFAPPEEPAAVVPPPPAVEDFPAVKPVEPSPVAVSAPAAEPAVVPQSDPPPQDPPPAAQAVEPTAPPPQPRRAFSLLPIFRRKETQPVEPAAPAAPPPAEPRPRVAIPKPRPPSAPLMPPVAVRPETEPPPGVSAIPASEDPAPEAAAETEIPDAPPVPVEPPAPQEPPAAAAEEPAPIRPPRTEAVLIETEHLPKTGSQARREIPDQDGLQAIFLTEETLGLDRVMELCGDLPGIRSCVLSHGTAVLASHKVPDSLDLVSLSAHAVEMLDAMRASSAKMGIGAVPAVTVHSAKGPITFFNQEDLCLLVLHKDRGFVPGVREKLQQVVEELSRANLPLPMPKTRPSLES